MERRRQLVDAALVVLERDGVAGFNHRAVAAEAGVALASATYHFDGIDDLAICAMLEATEAFKRALGESPDEAGLRGYAAALADELAHHRGRVVAGYELYLLAARRPALRDAATSWMQAGTDQVLRGLGPLRRQTFLAAVSAICLDALLADAPPTAEHITELLAHTLGEPGARGDVADPAAAPDGAGPP